jgi:hypothetical protein
MGRNTEYIGLLSSRIRFTSAPNPALSMQLIADCRVVNIHAALADEDAPDGGNWL